MKSSLQVGVSAELSTKVGPGNTITLGASQQQAARATVFSTPSMINLMEHAAREVLAPHLDSGQESVGVDVQIAHSSATPPRSEVTAQAVVTGIEKNVISFDVTARDAWGEIGRGTHRRAIIKTAKFASRLAEQKPPPTPTDSVGLSHPLNLQTMDTSLGDAILTVTLNRPEKRNAISRQMTGEMEALLNWLESAADIHVVIVRGAGDTFCAGDDVGDLPENDDEARQLSLRRGDVYRRMSTMAQTFIAAIDGLALGGGFVLAAACDLRIATHRAQLGLPEVTLGWPPNYGMGIVQSLIGRGRTLELALTGELIDARRAAVIGFVSRVVPASQLQPQVGQLAKQLAPLPAAARSAAKRLLSPDDPWCDEQATASFLQCIRTEAAQENISRFRKKRSGE